VDEDEAARLLADIIPAGTRKPINVERIQALVADYYNVTLDDMKGKRRDKHIVFPRQVRCSWSAKRPIIAAGHWQSIRRPRPHHSPSFDREDCQRA